MDPARAAVVTVSDGVSRGTREDESGDVASILLREAGFDVVTRRVIPDERQEIEATLRSLAGGHALLVTTGGTGFGPRDVTPEATRAVIDREAPGLAELMRAAGLRATPMAALSRAVAGSLGNALLLNLPGSPHGVRESLEAILPVVSHAVEILQGSTGRHPTGHSHGSPAVGAGTSDRADVGTVTVTAVRRNGAPPCPVGAKIEVGPGGPLAGTLGCAEFDAAAVEAGREALASGEPGTATFSHELGDIEVFVEPHRGAPQLLVLSATPVALELLGLGARLGYRAILVEHRPERVTPEHRAAADHVVASVDDVPIDGRTDAVHTDHDDPGLIRSLGTLVRSPARFIGVMGSRRHVAPHVSELRSRGFSDEEIARIRSPVGIDLGARTPAEIALSIAAGLVASRSGREAGWLDR